MRHHTDLQLAVYVINIDWSTSYPLPIGRVVTEVEVGGGGNHQRKPWATLCAAWGRGIIEFKASRTTVTCAVSISVAGVGLGYGRRTFWTFRG